MTTPAPADPTSREAVTASLTQRTVGGIFWTYVSLAVTRLGALITTVILARLLTPDDFGHVALAVIAVDLLGLVKDVGLGAALIHRQNRSPAAADTAFTLHLLLGTLLTFTGVALAPTIATWAGAPDVAPLLRWLSLSFVLEAIGGVHVVKLRLELDFRRKLRVDTVRAACKLAVSVAGALGGLGALALVVGQLAGQLAGSVAAWWTVRWVPRLRVDRTAARDLLRFGGRLTLADVLGVVEGRADLIVVGWWFGSAVLGVYTVASRMPALLASNLLWVTTGVLFPAYARVQDQPDRLRRAVLDTVRFSSMLYVPVALLLAVTADPLVPVLFGPQWADGVAVMRWLALAALMTALGYHMGDLLKSTGRTGIQLSLAAFELVVLLTATVIGASLGPTGVAVGRFVTSALAAALQVHIGLRIAGIGRASYLTALVPAGSGGVSLVAAAVVWRLALPGDTPLHLAGLTAMAVAAYVATVWACDRHSIRTLWYRVVARPAAPGVLAGAPRT